MLYFTFLTVLIALLINYTNAIICSAYCKPNFCTGILKTQCTACDPPFILQGAAPNSCIVDPSSGYVMYEDETVASMIPSSWTTICGPYNLYGKYGRSTDPSIRSNNLITIPHYSVKVIAWLLLYDGWDLVNDNFVGTINTTNQAITQQVSTYSNSQSLCGTSSIRTQSYMKLDMQFAHNQLNNRIRITLSTTDYNLEDWSVKQFMFLLAKCHLYCIICLDATNLQCSECDTMYYLSGTICNITCQYKYGVVSTSKICVPCDNLCTVCAQTSTNCSACQVTGLYQSFLSLTSCVTACPPKTTKSTTTHMCVPCNSSLCVICNTDAPSICTSCQAGSFWLNFDCLAACPTTLYFPQSPNCTSCDVSCQICSGSPSPCSSCSANYYLYTTQCLSICPPGFFGQAATRTCLECAIYCVKAFIQIQTTNQNLVARIIFSKEIDFNIFPYTNANILLISHQTKSLQNFVIKYQVVDQFSYSITLTPKSVINLTQTNFTVKFSSQTQIFYSIDGTPIDQLVFSLTNSTLWSIIAYPDLKQEQSKIIDQLAEYNQKINDVLALQIVQQIKKTGIFAIIFPGSQLCSTIILHNSIPTRNFYEGARFWASFTYFEVPKWEQGPHHIKYFGNTNLQQISTTNYMNWANYKKTLMNSAIKSRERLLQTADADNWRFFRTGYTHFFLFDTYIIVGIIILSWLLLLIAKIFYWKLNLNKRSIFYNILHKVNQISLFYITISVGLQWLSFSQRLTISTNQADTKYIYASFGLSIFATFYFLAYQVYIFYKIIPFSLAKAGTTKYTNYIQKYSYFLRDIRFQQYKADFTWNYKHLLRPYNYQLLSCIRLILLVVSLPIFHDYPIASILAIIIIQIFQCIRYILTWPYHSLCRNIYKLILQLCLLFIFIAFMCNYLMMVKIYQNLNAVADEYINVYFIIGWVGFILVFAYNIGFILYQIWDIIVGCKLTNQQRVQISRQQHYYQLLREHQNVAIKTLMMVEAQSLLAIKQKDNNFNIIKSVNMKSKKNLTIKIQQEDQQQYDKIKKQKKNKIQLKKSKFIQFLGDIHDAQLFYLQPNAQNITHQRKQIEQIIQRGNLTKKSYQNFQKFDVKIQKFDIRLTEKQRVYDASIYKIPQVFVRTKIDPFSNDNLLLPAKETKQIKFQQHVNRDYFQTVHSLFKKYANVTTQGIILTTFLTVDLNLYEPGHEVPQIQQNLSQSIQVIGYNGSSQKFKFDSLLPGFPIPYEYLQQL